MWLLVFYGCHLVVKKSTMFPDQAETIANVHGLISGNGVTMNMSYPDVAGIPVVKSVYRANAHHTDRIVGGYMEKRALPTRHW